MNNFENEAKALNIIKNVLQNEIESLDLRNLSLSTLPKELWKLKHLINLDVRGNFLENIPKEIAQLSKLKTFIANDNLLISLPEEIGTLKNLRAIYLINNKISIFPVCICNLPELAILAFGSVILDMGLEDWAKAYRKDWQAVHIAPGFAFGHRSVT